MEATDLSIASTAACADVELEDDAKALVRDDVSVGQLLQGLQQSGQFLDAIRVLARVLPKPRAVRWALQCREELADASTTPTEGACLQAVRAWLANPGDDPLRAAAGSAAEADGYRTPGAWIAAAVAWTGGSLSPAGQPVVPPPDHLTAHAVAGAIGLTAARGPDPDRIAEVQENYLTVGLTYVTPEGGAR
ncbi:MAG: hypothetical protein IPM29_16445 [Planctomycetes bacterium]|nr:hypothetical protein [Planctomycetota bacterium]